MTPEPATYTITYGSRRDKGLVRQENQDQLVSFDSSIFGQVFLLADGMGGHEGGAIAANMAITGFKRHFQSVSTTLPLRESLTEAARLTNLDIFEKGNETDGSLHGLRMGSTLVLCVLSGGGYVVAHVGDSRCYVFRNGILTRLTKDHTAVQKMVDAGILSPEEASNHPDASVLTRAFGQRPSVDLEISEPQSLAADEVLLLCSDGLYGYVDEAEITDRLRRNPDPQAAADALLQLALDAGGHDNISIFVIRAEPSSSKSITVPDPPELPAAEAGPATAAVPAVVASLKAPAVSARQAPARSPSARPVESGGGSRMRLAWWLIGIAALLAAFPVAAFLRPQLIPASLRSRLIAMGVALPAEANNPVAAPPVAVTDTRLAPQPTAPLETAPTPDSAGAPVGQKPKDPMETAAAEVKPPADRLPAPVASASLSPPAPSSVGVAHPPNADPVLMQEVGDDVKKLTAAGFDVKPLDEPEGAWRAVAPAPRMLTADHTIVLYRPEFEKVAERVCDQLRCNVIREVKPAELAINFGTGGVVLFVQPVAIKSGSPVTSDKP
jgi:serine/threonine protein phosphatase PrpC